MLVYYSCANGHTWVDVAGEYEKTEDLESYCRDCGQTGHLDGTRRHAVDEQAARVMAQKAYRPRLRDRVAAVVASVFF